MPLHGKMLWRYSTYCTAVGGRAAGGGSYGSVLQQHDDVYSTYALHGITVLYPQSSYRTVQYYVGGLR